MAATGRNVQGTRLYQQGQYGAALQQFQQAVASDPSNADAYYNMAATFHRMGSLGSNQSYLSQAETLYNQCLDLDQNHVDCHRGLAVLLVETGREDRAFNLLKNWALRSPNSSDARVELARLYYEFGDKETSQLHLNQAVQLDPQNWRTWKSLAYLAEESGDYSRAHQGYQRSYALNNMQPSVAARIASLQHLTNSQLSSPLGGTRTVNPGTTTPRY